MTGALVGLVNLVGTSGWVAVWLFTLVAAVVCIFRGRSGAGGCLGVAAILGLALQICGASVTGGVASALDFLPFSGGNLIAALLRSLGDAGLYALVSAGVLLQRPRPSPG